MLLSPPLRPTPARLGLAVLALGLAAALVAGYRAALVAAVPAVQATLERSLPAAGPPSALAVSAAAVPEERVAIP